MPEADLLALCEQLDGLRAAATDGEWWRESYQLYGEQFVEVATTEIKADAALIVATVNAMPALTAAVRALLADRDTLARVAALAEELQGWRDNAERYAEASNPIGSDRARGRVRAYERAIEGIRRALGGAS